MVLMLMMRVGHCAPPCLGTDLASEGARERTSHSSASWLKPQERRPYSLPHSHRCTLALSASRCLQSPSPSPSPSSTSTATSTHSRITIPPPPASPSFAHPRIHRLTRISDHLHNNLNRIHSHLPGASTTVAFITLPTARPPTKAFALLIHPTSLTWTLDNTLR